MATPSRSGVFAGAADPRVERFAESISVDRRLYAYDIEGSLAHAQMLAKTGLITAEECEQIRQALQQIRQEIEQGDFKFSAALEDIHMHIEQALIERLGDVGRRLHTGRSRNDQVTTDLRLWIRDAIDGLDQRVLAVQRAFVDRAEGDREVILPAYTHLQRAQPVLAVHYWLAYCEKLDRDRQRLADARRRANVLSLGTGAAAGTSLPIDRQYVCQLLGFDSLAANSLDASSDRDFVLDFAYAMSVLAAHLAGWAEEWILWSTHEFGFLRLPEQFCTCSSMMPQKMNPDVLELIRGRAARVTGNLTSLLVLVQGLPLAYNRDLQEDKQPLFDSYDTVDACLELAAPIVAGSQLNRSAIAARLEEGYLDATTLMEHLIGKGLPQRTAHHAVGTLVRKAIDRQVGLRDLPLEEFQAVYPDVDSSIYDMLGATAAVECFTSYGSTAPQQVEDQLRRWQHRLGAADVARGEG
ncbi:MAG: argininosuccinate lyase [Planctomycetales bacterium]|nr:argininosuccinate lyase [Planctomycetales bacterium]NIM08287.1 argininosuccinate lyase [Planctomycetales bacterium]NIN07780.1 argininosuccinate lyase [Planctomycetales bacterium]NIN76900.1 argininosuccinate lyase [Planctomycetales bacterium]NIO34099.1 argininosuccinate lyase [Planctomycetales bacterium]